ncbi:MAG TPA: TIGR02757 family protein [Chitinophagaceae bacterium]|jgi:uncharacterized protein (TIGR02757 family)|nr:TIGR02757 family protein [Chitinophagaceae bacterium]
MAAFPNKKELRDFLEKKVLQYNHPSFIATDPISVPHRFKLKQDIEIAGFFAAVFSWGNRTTIIRKSNELMKGMDDAPYAFIRDHQSADLKRLLGFKHRTFNATDLLYFIHFLKSHYQQSDSLESAFLPDLLNEKEPDTRKASFLTAEKRTTIQLNSAIPVEDEFVKKALSAFYDRFFFLEDAPRRTKKHIASPEKNSTCKRLNMYLRWMVRQDKRGVDFGIWKQISSADLICPVDLHVARVARGFGLISRKQTDWHTAMELTMGLRSMDKKDPVKFDFALFGLGVMEKY